MQADRGGDCLIFLSQLVESTYAVWDIFMNVSKQGRPDIQEWETINQRGDILLAVESLTQKGRSEQSGLLNISNERGTEGG